MIPSQQGVEMVNNAFFWLVLAVHPAVYVPSRLAILDANDPFLRATFVAVWDRQGQDRHLLSPFAPVNLDRGTYFTRDF